MRAKGVTKRFSKAVERLSEAYKKGSIEPSSCSKCCVGVICDGESGWSVNIVEHPLYYNGFVTRLFRYNNMSRAERVKQQRAIRKSNYNLNELHEIERVFMKGVEKEGYNSGGYDNTLLRKGLTKVVKYLAKLDNIENPSRFYRYFPKSLS